jgi:hypothetical protein
MKIPSNSTNAVRRRTSVKRADLGVKSHSFGCPEAATTSKKTLAFVSSCIADFPG